MVQYVGPLPPIKKNKNKKKNKKNDKKKYPTTSTAATETVYQKNNICILAYCCQNDNFDPVSNKGCFDPSQI